MIRFYLYGKKTHPQGSDSPSLKSGRYPGSGFPINSGSKKSWQWRQELIWLSCWWKRHSSFLQDRSSDWKGFRQGRPPPESSQEQWTEWALINVNTKVNAGKRMNCARRPMPGAFGDRMIRLKSSRLSLMAIPKPIPVLFPEPTISAFFPFRSSYMRFFQRKDVKGGLSNDARQINNKWFWSVGQVYSRGHYWNFGYLFENLFQLFDPGHGKFVFNPVIHIRSKGLFIVF